jgi:hypothetical protein
MHAEGVMRTQHARRWVWAAVAVQFLGYVYDALWHGVLNPGREPATRAEMAHHLGTVHLPLYIGAAAVLISTFLALLEQRRHSAVGVALPIAFAGALVSVAAEAWHAASHLRLQTDTAPVAGALSVLGFLVVVVAMSLAKEAASPRRA